MDVQKVEYRGWPNCYRWSNGLVDLVVTADVGPRIIRFGFVGEANEFKEYPEMLGEVGGDEWRIYGGHRLWHAPEAMPRTYFPDNGPVEVQVHPTFIRVVQPVEAHHGHPEGNGHLAGDGPSASGLSTVCGTAPSGRWSWRWALSVMAPGGMAILPLPPRGRHEEHLLPTGAPGPLGVHRSERPPLGLGAAGTSGCARARPAPRRRKSGLSRRRRTGWPTGGTAICS